MPYPIVIDERLTQPLRQWRALRPHDPWFIAVSGGAHSAALLAVAAHLWRSEVCNHTGSLEAIHVHHGFAGSDRLAAAAAKLCEQCEVALTVHRVTVIDDQSEGLEAAARRARYKAFEATLEAGGVLVLAHHENDQAETVFLRLMRGSGRLGLQGMVERRAHGHGELLRPWLAVPEPVVRAGSEGQPFWEDPMNADTRFDRVFLRQTVLPLLASRWPQLTRVMARTSRVWQESSADSVTRLPDWYREGVRRLARDELLKLSQDQRFALLRHCLQSHGCTMPSLQSLMEFDRTLLGARVGRQAVLKMAEGEWRMTRSACWFGPTLPTLPLTSVLKIDPRLPVELPGLGSLKVRSDMVAGFPELQVVPARGTQPQRWSDGRILSAVDVLKRGGFPSWVRDRALLVATKDQVLELTLPQWSMQTQYLMDWYQQHPVNSPLSVSLIDWQQAPVWLTDRE